ncbi:ABC transporter ATP-binding protein [Marinivivus vitaminiproducens]|uniref:ABC transporter ATP-binding protein n=1 Tax=Marinivivus vitaminiproducens TaxID=3035935 RepID=UPI003FA072A6
MVEAIGLTKRFGSGEQGVTALDRVDVTIRPGEFFTLLGPSGCGKTTLLRLIAGLEQADAGELRLDGGSITGLPPYRRPVNTVFQSYALFPHLSIARNVAFGLEMRRLPRGEIDAQVAQALSLVRLDGYEKRMPAQLSGGQQQRVALARALANRPKVLLLDEPLSALDLKLRKEMQLELRRLKEATGITFVFVTHDQNEALTMSDRIAVMDKGRVLQVGTPIEIYDRPQTRFVADFIGEANLLAATASGDGRRFAIEGTGDVVLGDDERSEPGRRVTLAVRPERAVVTPPGDGGFDATVEQLIYAGNETHLHVILKGGQPFRVCLPNHQGAAPRYRAGEALGVVLPPEACHVLAD